MELKFDLEPVSSDTSNQVFYSKIYCKNLTGYNLDELSLIIKFNNPIQSVVRENDLQDSFYEAQELVEQDENSYTWAGIDIDKDLVLVFQIKASQPIAIKDIKFEIYYKKIESIVKKDVLHF